MKNENVWELINESFVINSVEKVTGVELSGLCIKRNSYINRVFELEEKASKKRLIVKLYRPKRWTKKMIEEEHSFVRDLFDNDNHVICPIAIDGKTIFVTEGLMFSLYEKMGGRALDEFDKDGWINIGTLIGKMHLLSSKRKSSNRIVWKPSVATKEHLETILSSDAVPLDFIDPLTTTINSFIKTSTPLFVDEKFILLHGDCHMGNFIHRPGEGTYILDFDDMCIGLAVQDLWMLLPDSVDNSLQEINWFIEGYKVFNNFEYSQIKMIPYLRAMRMIHFASWCAVQKYDPSFQKNFPLWGDKKYWGDLIRNVATLH